MFDWQPSVVAGSGQRSPVALPRESSPRASPLDSKLKQSRWSLQASSPFFFGGYLISQDHSEVWPTVSSESLALFFDAVQDLDRCLDRTPSVLLFPTPDGSWEVGEPLKNGCFLLPVITLDSKPEQASFFNTWAHGEDRQGLLPLGRFWYQALSLPAFCQAHLFIPR